jgi:MFS transporter, FHS family, glucose/mannose:H+ symporter
MALAGFLLSGFLLALLGAMLPAWGFHRDPPEFVVVGNYFLCLAIGVVAAARLAPPIIARRGVSFLLITACSVAAAALIYLAAVSSLLSPWWRGGGLLLLGIGAGLLNVSLFHAISGIYQADVAGTVSKGGVWYGLGCMAATVLVAGAIYACSPAAILVLMALAPAVFAGLYARSGFELPTRASGPSMRQAWQDFRSPGAIMFALLLFFQFGNEWSLAGWLPLFLTRRIGMSPNAALYTLALYWLFLMGGRLGAAAILPRVRHGRLLLGSVLAALFGCLVLSSTKTGFGAVSGAFFVAAGYASIFPLVAEAIGRRFPYYHPAFFNGIFSVALVGGLLAPATVGYAASVWGVGVVIGIPLLGAFMVALLVVLIWLETKVTGR